MLKNASKKGIFAKAVFDGYDFYQMDFGRILVPDELWDIVLPHSFSTNYGPAQMFLDWCEPDTEYIGELGKKYKVRKYKLKDYKECPMYNTQYILFNPILEKVLEAMTEFNDIEFYVCPSFDNLMNVDGLGFRIANPEIVESSFKWIFMSGNNIIYGKERVDKDKRCYIVEGFRDYVALTESGFNCIGLGSVEISKLQNEFIKELKEPVLLMDNDMFGMKKLLEWKGQKAILIGTEAKDAWDAFERGDKIKICQIK